MLVKWNPYTELEGTVNGLFDRPFGLRPIWDARNEEAVVWQPSVNVYEDKDHLAIEAQLPGIDLNDIELSVKEQTLHLRGERKAEAVRRTIDNGVQSDVPASALKSHDSVFLYLDQDSSSALQRL